MHGFRIHREWLQNRRWSWRERVALAILAVAAIPVALLGVVAAISIGALVAVVLLAALGAGAALSRRRRRDRNPVIGAEYVHLDETTGLDAGRRVRRSGNPWARE